MALNVYQSSSKDLPTPECNQFKFNPEDFSNRGNVIGPTPGSDGTEGVLSCPCGFGSSGIPQADTYGVWKASYPQGGTWFPNPPPAPESQPTCAIKVPFGQPPPFIGQCWTEYLSMPFCKDQNQGVWTMGNLAVGPNGHAKCRSDGQIAALTVQDRIDIYNNTWTDSAGTGNNFALGYHPNGLVTLPFFRYSFWSSSDPTTPFADGLYAPFKMTVSWNANGTIQSSMCGYGWMACPQVCFGCTASTVTACPNPSGCQGYDPSASLLLFNTAQTIDTCCIHGCTDNTTLANGYPDINGNDTNGNPCTYPCANGYFNQNYNPQANCNDNSCLPPPGGCIDIAACNYDPLAVVDDGSCCYVLGCTDPLSLNYNSNACCDDGSCCYISGCTNPLSSNYNPLACFDDGSCNMNIPGCMDSYACNYCSGCTISVPNDCNYPACYQPNALNTSQVMPAYDCDCNFLPTPIALANPPYGSAWCCNFNFGCTDPLAYNYNSNYQGCDNGLGVPTPSNLSCCEYPTWHCNVPQGGCTTQNNQNGYDTMDNCLEQCVVGCTDPAALNYNPNATIPCGPFNNYPTYLGCCDYPVIPGCTDELAIWTTYNAFATVDDGSCRYRTGEAAWKCEWGSVYDPNADPGTWECNNTDMNGQSYYPALMNSGFNGISRCWNWDYIQGIWSLVLLRPGGGTAPNGLMLLWDSTNPHPRLGDLTDPNNPKISFHVNLVNSNPIDYPGPLFSWNPNVVTHNGISNFGYWMPVISVPQPPDYSTTPNIPGQSNMNNSGFIPKLWIRLEAPASPLYIPWSSSNLPADCCIEKPGTHPNDPCPPFVTQYPGGGLGEEPDIPIINGVPVVKPTEGDVTRMSYRQLGLELKNTRENITLTLLDVENAFMELSKEITPVLVPDTAGSFEWWRCNSLSTPCFCEAAPYVNGQQVLDMITFGSHYLGTNDTSCINDTNNCCDPAPPPVINSWACVKKALPPGPTGISPSGWRYVCEDVGPNGPGALYESLQVCESSPCQGDPNISYSPPCTTIGGIIPVPFGCTKHNNSDCGGILPCYLYKQDCNGDNNCPDVTPLP